MRQVRPVIFYPTKFANCYQSRKALFSCFGARQIFVRREIWWMFQSTSQNIKLRACKFYLLNLPLRLSTSFVPTEEHILWRKIPFKILSGYFLIKSQFSCWKLINRVCYCWPFSDFLIHCYFPCLILFPMLGQNILSHLLCFTFMLESLDHLLQWSNLKFVSLPEPDSFLNWRVWKLQSTLLPRLLTVQGWDRFR